MSDPTLNKLLSELEDVVLSEKRVSRLEGLEAFGKRLREFVNEEIEAALKQRDLETED